MRRIAALTLLCAATAHAEKPGLPATPRQLLLCDLDGDGAAERVRVDDGAAWYDARHPPDLLGKLIQRGISEVLESSIVLQYAASALILSALPLFAPEADDALGGAVARLVTGDSGSDVLSLVDADGAVLAESAIYSPEPVRCVDLLPGAGRELSSSFQHYWGTDHLCMRGFEAWALRGGELLPIARIRTDDCGARFTPRNRGDQSAIVVEGRNPRWRCAFRFSAPSGIYEDDATHHCEQASEELGEEE